MGALSQRIARGPKTAPVKQPAPEPVVDKRPAWLRRRDEGLLPAKVLSA